MFVVVYPKGQGYITDFEFKYWTDNYTKTTLGLALALDHNGPHG